MTIAELRAKSKALIEATPRDVVIVATLILSASASFGLGVLAGRDTLGAGEREGFSTSQRPLTAGAFGAFQEMTPPDGPARLPDSIRSGGQVAASKNGTKYFLPWCGGAKQISEANKIWFASNKAAEDAGYKPAANCKGL